MTILEQYELEKKAQAEQETDKISPEEAEVIEKYAEMANDFLAAEYGDDYTAEDIEKLATLLIQHDAEAVENEDMQKEASAEELAIIEKYAEVANEMLAKEYGKDYTVQDVEKLATLLIQHDAEVAAAENEATSDVEKVAEYKEAGRIMAQAFIEELAKTNG